MLALVVAVLAVALGLALGLAPGARRRALGPLRTMALTAVIAVIAVHLLPEALAELGWLGLALFALALGLPRWWRLFARAPQEAHPHVGLELGFWGLVVHHLGDGLALGAYSHVDEATGHAHSDVLLALVLHTVPLVAVISAGYARAWGTRSAIARASVLAAASCLGVLAARMPSPALVEQGQAWIAAGVAGLLLHGISHDIGEDLPVDAKGRALDLLAALFGGGFGWLSAALDGHAEATFSAALSESFSRAVERTALPLLVGLLVGALLAGRVRAPGSPWAEGLRSSAERAGLGPESLLVGVAQLGAVVALSAHALVLCVLALATAPVSPAARPAAVGFREALERRLDWFGAWALAAVLMSVVIEAGIPGAALAPLNEWVLLAAAAWVGVGMPLPALAAVLVAHALSTKGLAPSVTLLFSVWPPSAERVRRAGAWLALPALVLASVALGRWATPHELNLDPRLSWIAAGALSLLLLLRIYRVGLRSWIVPLGVAHERGG